MITNAPSSITTPTVERNLAAAVAWVVLPRIAFVALEGATFIAAAVAGGGIALAPLMAMAAVAKEAVDAGSLAYQAEAGRDLPAEWVRECEEAKSGWFQDFERGLRRQLVNSIAGSMASRQQPAYPPISSSLPRLTSVPPVSKERYCCRMLSRCGTASAAIWSGMVQRSTLCALVLVCGG